MKVYLNSEGAILQTVPSVIGRGSTVTDFEVEAPFSAAIMAVRFTLRTGTTEPLVLPMVSAVSSPDLNLWSAKIPFAVTKFAGQVPYTLEVRDADGYMIASPGGTLTISPGATPTIPEAPPKNAWDAIRDYLNQIIANSNEVSQDVRNALQWIENFENLKGISLTEDGGAIRVYKLIKSGDLDALLAMLKAYQNGNLGGGNGTPGADGFSPIAKVEQTDSGASITITDKNGTTTATVNHGKDGKNGVNAISPVVDISAVTGGHRVSITDINGEKYFDVMNGANGADGANGTAIYYYGGESDPVNSYGDLAQVELPEGKALQVGDLLVDANGKLYSVTMVQESGSLFKAEEIASLKGADGSPGDDGKSAYAYAQEGGYTGTEEELAGKLAAGSLQVEFTSTGEADDELGLFLFVANKSVSYCIEAFKNGIPVYSALDPMGEAFAGVMVTCSNDTAVFEVANSLNVAKRYMILGTNDGENDMWMGTYSDGATMADIPTDDHINSLIDAKLGVIENGSY